MVAVARRNKVGMCGKANESKRVYSQAPMINGDWERWKFECLGAWLRGLTYVRPPAAATHQSVSH
ncbi:hypothetical protein M569_16092 [Genlisea aurea]|uniref:Uncharacterized protein n=1 Tax=Genlisea aurea TaxID=192259 RepID=S8C2Q9_9LAMI|nr:hypothetical protein M569_16092 [Genlisea aurea]